jgi:hypothetical protein
LPFLYIRRAKNFTNWHKLKEEKEGGKETKGRKTKPHTT